MSDDDLPDIRDNEEEHIERMSERGDDADEVVLLAQPWRMLICVTAGCEDREEAGVMLDKALAQLEEIGFFIEFSFADTMDVSEVIEGSPLDEVITGVRSRG